MLSEATAGSIYDKGKVVPVLNEAPRHEDVLGDGSIAPRILNLETRRRWVVRASIMAGSCEHGDEPSGFIKGG